MFTVSTAVPLPPAARFMLTGFRLHVGGLCAPAGEAIREQLRFIVPEYVLPAVKVTSPVALDPGETGEREIADITNRAMVTTAVELPVA